MNRLLFFISFALIILCVAEGGNAGLAYPHRYHKRHGSTLKHQENSLAPRYVGNVKRDACRVRPSSQSTVSSVSSAVVTVQSVALPTTSSSALATPSVQSVATPSISSSSVEAAATNAVPATIAQPTSSPVPATTAPVPPTTNVQATASAVTSSTQSQTSTSSDTSQSDIDQYLNDQNTVRAQHGAVALTWNNTLAAAAQEWANGCIFEHSGGKLGPYGENLAAGTGSSYGIAAAISSWTDEVSQYSASDPVASHFTQVVWKASTEVGCAVQECSGIFPASYGEAQYYVCEYYPQGNIIGQFTQNVQV